MEIFVPIVLVIIFFVLFSICGWCCKKHKEGTVYGYAGAPVTVANQHVNASPVVVPPYPIDARHPTPQQSLSQAPPPGFAPPPGGYQTGGYPPPTGAAPYPTGGPGYPPHGGPGYPPNSAPYPPNSAPYPPQTAPPSYNEAVAHPPPMSPVNELYAKQAPYNPNY